MTRKIVGFSKTGIAKLPGNKPALHRIQTLQTALPAGNATAGGKTNLLTETLEEQWKI